MQDDSLARDQYGGVVQRAAEQLRIKAAFHYFSCTVCARNKNFERLAKWCRRSLAGSPRHTQIINATSEQVRLPAEFKHINKRRKRN